MGVRKKSKQIRISVKKLKKARKALAVSYHMSIAAHKVGIPSGDVINDFFHKIHLIDAVLRWNKNKFYVVIK